MKYKGIEEALDKFGKTVVANAKKNLVSDGMNKGPLYDNLDYDLTYEQNAFLLDFLIEDYGMFQDAGVYGSKPSLVKKGKQKGRSTNSVFTGAQGIKSRFSYKTKKPPLEPLMKWAKYKNIRFREKDTGRFKKGNYKAIGFWIQKRIFAQGLAPTLFFTKAFRQSFKELPKQILEEFKLDVERQIIYGEK